MVNQSLRVIYPSLFLGVLLTGVGLAYYHLDPNNDTLIWDRIPITTVFMSLFAAVVAQMVSQRWGLILLLPFLVIGIDYVLWWHWTEGQGNGDLRHYRLVQFYPGLFIPLILWLFYTPANKPIVRALEWVVIWYAVAKILEAADYPI